MIPSEIRDSLGVRMAALNISASILCEYCGWSAPQLSGFLNNKRQGVPFSDVLYLHNIVVKLERLSDLAKPLPVDFRNKPLIDVLLQKLKAGDLTISIVGRSMTTGVKGGVQALVHRDIADVLNETPPTTPIKDIADVFDKAEPVKTRRLGPVNDSLFG